ncbi:ATP-dependent zinc metalloprotease FtsH [Myxococcota bacterium]|nr:ATP-dependent zinc metalloprotease FtsH [Myxococcota bacterium]
MKQGMRTFLIWLLFIGLFVMVLMHSRGGRKSQEIDFSEFISKALPAAETPDGPPPPTQVEAVRVKGERLEGTMVDGSAFTTVGDLKDFQKDLIARGVKVSYESQEVGIWVTILTSWLPMLLFVFLFVMFMRQTQSGGGKLFSFGKSRHRVLSESSRKVTFQDIAGIDEAKEELQEIIEFLKEPQRFTKLGGRIPKGVLLMGPPGTGKTLLARGVAGEAGVPFLSISGSDFVEMFVGVGASRVRDLFEEGKKRAPCIIFIDEIDAVGRQRGAGLGGGHDEREQTLNQLLVEMDGFEVNTGVIIMAATNRPDVLDPALLRPGRFDRRVVVPSPDVKGREAILRVHCRKVPLAEDVRLDVVAKGTPGFVGADLENLVNEAALLAARKGQDQVMMADLEEAKDKVLMGAARRSIVMSEHERELTAYHEAGHTIVAKTLPGADPIHKVTIVPRGLSLGMTQQLPSEDRYTASRTYLVNRLAILMGGRSAEMLMFGEESSGAGQDIRMATEQARRMVSQFGMSILGPIYMDHVGEMVFLGKDLTSQREISEATAQRVDREVKRLILSAQDEAVRILTERKAALEALAAALLEHETLDGDEVDRVIGAVPVPAAT